MITIGIKKDMSAVNHGKINSKDFMSDAGLSKGRKRLDRLMYGVYKSEFEEILDYYFVNRAIRLDYKCKDKNAMYITKCTRAGR